jgi:hypothetical protein
VYLVKVYYFRTLEHAKRCSKYKLETEHWDRYLQLRMATGPRHQRECQSTFTELNLNLYSNKRMHIIHRLSDQLLALNENSGIVQTKPTLPIT